MKIVFLCSSMEPGRDGVGDYTRRLAKACAEQGHDCLALALNDRHVQSFATETLATNFTVSRWPARLSWTARRAAIIRQITAFGPDRISWQMVSYGYQPKGILGPEIIALGKELRGPRAHVMLHEMWIGIAKGDSWAMRTIGWWQRRALLAFLSAVAPEQLHTSNPAYVAALKLHGWEATVLPLFSNIPIAPASPEDRRKAVARHLPAATGNRGRLICVTFGTLHQRWQPEPTAALLQCAAARQGSEPVVLAIGRTGAHGPGILRRFSQAGVTVAATGEVPSAEISLLLQSADLGIGPHPRALIKKSGAVAAMLDHGLPILMPRDDWQPRQGPASISDPDPRLAPLADLTPANLHDWLRHRDAPGSSFPSTVASFLHQLS